MGGAVYKLPLPLLILGIDIDALTSIELGYTLNRKYSGLSYELSKYYYVGEAYRR